MITDDECGAVSAERRRVGREIGKQIQAAVEMRKVVGVVVGRLLSSSHYVCCRSAVFRESLQRAHYVCYAMFELNSCGPKRKNFQ